jgi:5-methylthioribose kinase
VFELTAEAGPEYLVSRGMPRPRLVRELGGGVSNTVLLVEGAGAEGGRLVLKQALGRLRVEQEWLSERTRIFRESAALARLAPHLPPGSLPEVLFEDRGNCLFAMSAAPPGARTWKAHLLEGDASAEIAGRIGGLLGAIVRATWRNPEWAAAFGDQTVFDQLRLDPYYRSTARRHPDLAGCFESLMRDSGARRVALVHGDWSPKNFLVLGGEVTLIDFECVHFGDPSFDAAFLVNHLLLKSFLNPGAKPLYAAAAMRFYETFAACLPEPAGWLEGATLAHLAALMLARVDGKSPVEYLDGGRRSAVRSLAREWVARPPSAIREVFERI